MGTWIGGLDEVSGSELAWKGKEEEREIGLRSTDVSCVDTIEQ